MEPTQELQKMTANTMDLLAGGLEQCKQYLKDGMVPVAVIVLDHITKTDFPFLQQLVLQGIMFHNNLWALSESKDEAIQKHLSSLQSRLKRADYIIAALFVALAVTWGVAIPYMMRHPG